VYLLGCKLFEGLGCCLGLLNLVDDSTLLLRCDLDGFKREVDRLGRILLNPRVFRFGISNTLDNWLYLLEGHVEPFFLFDSIEIGFLHSQLPQHRHD
jgi:hypothetical protein